MRIFEYLRCIKHLDTTTTASHINTVANNIISLLTSDAAAKNVAAVETFKNISNDIYKILPTLLFTEYEQPHYGWLADDPEGAYVSHTFQKIINYKLSAFNFGSSAYKQPLMLTSVTCSTKDSNTYLSFCSFAATFEQLMLLNSSNFSRNIEGISDISKFYEQNSGAIIDGSSRFKFIYPNDEDYSSATAVCSSHTPYDINLAFSPSSMRAFADFLETVVFSGIKFDIGGCEAYIGYNRICGILSQGIVNILRNEVMPQFNKHSRLGYFPVDATDLAIALRYAAIYEKAAMLSLTSLLDIDVDATTLEVKL